MTPVASGSPVMFVATPLAGVPRAGVIRVGEVRVTEVPLEIAPVIPANDPMLLY